MLSPAPWPQQELLTVEFESCFLTQGKCSVEFWKCMRVHLHMCERRRVQARAICGFPRTFVPLPPLDF